MKDIFAELNQYPVATPLSLSGTIVVGRDIAHAKIQERLDEGKGMPDYLKTIRSTTRACKDACR